jgi:hypothetical protein
MRKEDLEACALEVARRLVAQGFQRTYVVVAGGAAAYVAGKTRRRPNNIDVFVGYTYPMYENEYADPDDDDYERDPDIKPFMYRGFRVNTVADVDALLWDKKAHVEKARSLLLGFDVPQHRVGFVLLGGKLGEALTDGWADVWSRETMLGPSGALFTTTARAHKFVQAGYKTDEHIRNLAMAYEMGLDANVYCERDRVCIYRPGQKDAEVGWDELLTVAIRHNLSQGRNGKGNST